MAVLAVLRGWGGGGLLNVMVGRENTKKVYNLLWTYTFLTIQGLVLRECLNICSVILLNNIEINLISKPWWFLSNIENGIIVNLAILY